MPFLIIIIILLLFICFYLYNLYDKEKNKKIEIVKRNKRIIKENEQKEKENEKINNQLEKSLKRIEQAKKTLSNMQDTSRASYEKYCDALDESYLLKEREYEEAEMLLKDSYDKIQDEVAEKVSQIRLDLDKISATRAAAIQAQLKEQEIQEKAEYYSLSLEEIDKKEVRILQSIESELRDPRPIRMIIWNAYYTKKANDLCARVLGNKDITGIYKITNKNNGLCYIGQAKKMRERWREHMKCGLGIDTPASNKLYQAMRKEGLDTFTFELLEECAAADLDEKESFYIDLYNSYSYGYNSNRGNKKS